jgi:chromosomal replication initiation ATPase DnaA
MEVAMAAAQEIGWALGEIQPGRVPVQRVFAVVCAAFCVTDDELIAHRRNDRTVVIARKVAMYVARKRCGLSYPNIGKAFCRDHTTVMAAERAVTARMLTDVKFGVVVERVMRETEAT